LTNDKTFLSPVPFVYCEPTGSAERGDPIFHHLNVADQFMMTGPLPANINDILRGPILSSDVFQKGGQGKKHPSLGPTHIRYFIQIKWGCLVIKVSPAVSEMIMAPVINVQGQFAADLSEVL
jgi:hypothetical protein